MDKITINLNCSWNTDIYFIFIFMFIIIWVMYRLNFNESFIQNELGIG